MSHGLKECRACGKMGWCSYYADWLVCGKASCLLKAMQEQERRGQKAPKMVITNDPWREMWDRWQR